MSQDTWRSVYPSAIATNAPNPVSRLQSASSHPTAFSRGDALQNRTCQASS
ncbi:MAG: hypothetical protein AB4040_14800 [Synechococcus sp.]